MFQCEASLNGICFTIGMIESTTFSGALTFSQFAAAARENLLGTVAGVNSAPGIVDKPRPTTTPDNQGTDGPDEGPEMRRPPQLHFVYVRQIVGGQAAAKRRLQAADSFYAVLLNRCG